MIPTKVHIRLYQALLIGLSIVISAWVLAVALKKFRSEDRKVLVRGFAERDVKADLAIWPIKLKVAASDLAEGSKILNQNRDKVMAFLKTKGVADQSITVKDLNVTDRMADEYAGNNQIAQYRYLIEEVIEVRSTQVDLIQQVSRMTNELLNAGVALNTRNEWRNSGVKFMFTKLNQIKPEMVADAIQNAKQSALAFAAESESDLGKIHQAQQGFFTVQDREQSLSNSAEGGYYEPSSSDIYKRVRVVISIEYSLN